MIDDDERIKKIYNEAGIADIFTTEKITIDNQNEIFVFDKNITIDKLRKLVRKYESKNKSESIISLEADRDTKYRIYVDTREMQWLVK
jgi:biopolymer transport protein ExbD